MTRSPLVIERTLPADCAAVFAAWTDPVALAQWFFVDSDWSAEFENELEVGGSYRLRMTTAAGEVHTMQGEYLEIEAPRRLRFTWSSHVARNTTVTIELTPTAGGTHLRLVHEGLTNETTPPHLHGWNGCLGNLERVLSRTGSSSRV